VVHTTEPATLCAGSPDIVEDNMTPEQIEKLAERAAKYVEDPDAMKAFRERLGLTPEQWTQVAIRIPDFLERPTD